MNEVNPFFIFLALFWLWVAFHVARQFMTMSKKPEEMVDLNIAMDELIGIVDKANNNIQHVYDTSVFDELEESSVELCAALMRSMIKYLSDNTEEVLAIVGTHGVLLAKGLIVQPAGGDQALLLSDIRKARILMNELFHGTYEKLDAMNQDNAGRLKHYIGIEKHEVEEAVYIAVTLLIKTSQSRMSTCTTIMRK